ncbi:hypothetical protein BSL78_10304 [Apostichopus japonicus]|uniref:Protein MMS22-like n=1 Tax=Stichopus japonicus TaxID=307972 RepID=A0A2G8KXP9_STIJA|nr:hypothetical protein BSL78_10304 [Apostichopus japonicus]
MQNINFEFSPTPPASPESIDDAPVPVDEILPGDLPCFDCRKQRLHSGIFHPSPNGYLVDGVVARILEGIDPSPNMYTYDLLLMFGHHYITKTALVDKLDHLFSIARQKIIELERLLDQTQNWIMDDKALKEAVAIHQEVLAFLRYVVVYVHRNLEISSDGGQLRSQNASDQEDQFYEEVVRNLLGHLQEFLLFVDRLSSFNSTKLHQYASSTSSQNFLTHFAFHVKLDLHWGVVLVLQCLQRKFTGSKLDESICGLLNQEIREILEDLVFLASIRLKKFVSEIHGVTVFPCSCVQELWCLMMHLINVRSSTQNELLQVVVTNLMEKKMHFSSSDDDVPSKEIWKENNSYLLSLWLVEELAPLCKISCYGNIQEMTISGSSQWSLIQLVLRKAFSDKDNPPDEVTLQRYLRIILSASSTLGAYTKLLIYLWDVLSKRINEKQQFSVVGFQNSSYASKSACHWYNSCKQRCQNNKASLSQEDSFNLFVRILALQLSGLEEQERQQSWKQLQGRLFLTLRGSFLNRLNGEGLTRILTLFLALMMVQGVDDLFHCVLEVLDKISSLSSISNIISTEFYCFSGNLLGGLFAISLAQQDALHDLSPLADRLVQDFNKNCSLFKQTNLDAKDRSTLWSKICNYVMDVQDVIEGSRWLNLSEEKLIGQGFSFVLPACTDAELPRMLTFIQTVIQHFRNISNKKLTDGSEQIPDTDLLQKKHSAMAKSLWGNIYPFIEACALRQTAPPMIVDLSVSFTQLAIDMDAKVVESNVHHPKASTLFEYYGLGNRGVHHSISAGYLCRLLPDRCAQLTSTHRSGQVAASVVQTWFRCSMSQPGSSNQLRDLTDLVFKHPQMSEILRYTTQDWPRRDVSHPPSVLDFIKACSLYVSSSESTEISTQRKQTLSLLFGDLTMAVKRLMKDQSSKASCLWIYEVISQTFKYCANYICPQFMEGLASFNLEKDPVMKKKLQDVVVKYFPRFQEMTTPLARMESNRVMLSHPLEKVLYRSCAKEPTENLIKLRYYVIKFLVDGYMPLPVQETKSSNLMMVVKFFNNLLQKTLSEKQICRDAVVLLRPVLQYLLLSDPNYKGRISPLLTVLMQGAKKCQPTEFKHKELLDCFREFLTRYLSYHHGAVFKVLEVAALQYPALLEPLIPDCKAG